MGLKQCAYSLSAHARDRMLERGVSEAEVLLVLERSTDFDLGAVYGRMTFRAQICGRPITVCLDVFTNLIITVVAPAHKQANSAYGWFSVGACVETKRQ